MKKLLSALTLSLVLMSCSETGALKKFTLNASKISLQSESTYTLTGNKDITKLESSSEYVATVNDLGEIEAKRVGTATITAYSEKESAKCQVEVTPRFNLYRDPGDCVGKSLSEIKNLYGTPDASENGTIGYKNVSSSTELLMFMIESGKCTSACAMVKTAYMSDLMDFLKERYVVAGYDTDTDIGIFVNALDGDNVTLYIAIQVYSVSYLMVLYGPYSSTKSIDSNNYYYSCFTEFIESNENIHLN